jgi:hypothetical protein
VNPTDIGTASSRDVASDLISYVRLHLASPVTVFSEPPVRFASGVENRVYGFRLNAVEAELSGPLVLRVYARTAGG